MNKKARFSAGFFIFKTMSQRLKKRMIVTKMVIFEYRSGAYFKIREHRHTGNRHLQADQAFFMGVSAYPALVIVQDTAQALRLHAAEHHDGHADSQIPDADGHRMR